MSNADWSEYKIVHKSMIGDIGVCTVWKDDSNNIHDITLKLLGTLQSYRDKNQNRYKSKKYNDGTRKKDSNAWMEKIKFLGAFSYLEELQKQCLEHKKRIRITGIIHRKYPIRDQKNLDTGFDHMILDGLVRLKIFKNDDMKNLIYRLNQEKPVSIFNDFMFIVFDEEKP